jgi:outer membrane receptor protein involved in Fe transport
MIVRPPPAGWCRLPNLARQLGLTYSRAHTCALALARRDLAAQTATGLWYVDPAAFTDEAMRTVRKASCPPTATLTETESSYVAIRRAVAGNPNCRRRGQNQRPNVPVACRFREEFRRKSGTFAIASAAPGRRNSLLDHRRGDSGVRVILMISSATAVLLWHNVVAQPADNTAPPTQLPPVEVIGASPLLGSGVDRTTVPAQNQVLNSRDLSLQGPASLQQALQDQAEGVHTLNASGNPYQPDIFYHGFQASALQGTSQGLAVYVNGVRFNNPFGDTVNWDLIPDIAIDQVNLVGANPVFGLNALGGALSVQLKNGFNYHGGELDAFGGSFGQIAGQLQYGKQIGNTAAYVAASGLHENGWRDFQSTGLKQFYGDVGWRSDRAELHFSVDLAQTTLNGPGTVPVQLLEADRQAQFTGPNVIGNNYGRVVASGSYDFNDTTSLQAFFYYNNLLQRVANGNGSPLTPCGGGSSFLCGSSGDVATDLSGNPISAFLGPNGAYASLAQQTTNSNGYGTSLQVTNSDPLFGHTNQLVVGFSFDGAQTTFSASTSVGALDVASRNFLGPNIVIDLAGGSIAPVRAAITDGYYGLFLTDTLNVTSALAVTVSGRFNSAQIGIKDQTGTSLTGVHVYNRFNPAIGLTYRLAPWISLYAGYAESNRAPTPAELTCSDPSAPCSLANFFTGDPNLKQVVAHTFEVGLRGQFAPYDHARLDWNLGAFRSSLSDDIIFAQSSILGTGFFQNIGATLRQGIDAGLRYTSERWTAWINYSYTDATFQSSFVESSPNNPAADANGDINVHPGNRLPGVPAHQFKIGGQYKITDKWTVGATAIAASGQYLFGDEANLTKKLPGYFLLNLNTSYQVTKTLQLFALMQNAFNATYYTYGTFSPTTSVPIVQVPNATNTRSYNIGAPIAAFAGMKLTF